MFTLFVFRRGIPHVALIVGYLLLLWLLVAVLVQVRGTLEASERRAHRFVLTATEYSIQTLYHGVLLFLLPAYWAATTLTSPNVLFLALLAALALLATFDPWYRRLVHPWPLGRQRLLPGLGVRRAEPGPAAGRRPAVRRPADRGLDGDGRADAGGVSRARLAWIYGAGATIVGGRRPGDSREPGRGWSIPPAPLFLARDGARLGGRQRRVAGAGAGRSVPVAELRERGLIAYTAIYAPGRAAPAGRARVAAQR